MVSKNVSNRLLNRPKPRPEESLYSWLVRLGIENGYPNHYWLKRFLGLISTNERTKPILILSDDQKKWITKVAGVDESFLEDCCWLDVLYRNTRLVMPVFRSFICRPYQQICPQCFDELGIWKKSWDLNAVACCPIHECYLISRCFCGRLIPVFPNQLHRCDCGRRNFGNRKTKAPEELCAYVKLLDVAPDNKQGLLNRLFEHRLISWFWAQLNPRLMKVPMVSWDLRTRHLAAKFVSGHAACPESSFYELMDRYVHYRRKSNKSGRFGYELGAVQDSINRMESQGYSGAIRDLFDNYLVEHWDGQYWLIDRLGGGYESLTKLRSELGMREVAFQRLCGRLQIPLYEDRLSTRYFAAEEKQLLVDEKEKTLSLGALAKELGVSRYLAHGLVRGGVISGVAPSRKKRIRNWQISITDIEGFVCSLTSKSTRLIGVSISVKQLMKVVLPKRVSLVHILSVLLRGEVRYECAANCSILGIKILIEDVNHIQCSYESSRSDSRLMSVADVAKLLDVSGKMVHSLVRRRLLVPYVSPGHHRSCSVLKFSNREVQKYQKLNSHSPSLLSLRAASFRLGKDRSWLRKQLIKKQFLGVYWLDEYPGEIFLSELDVSRWSSMLDKTFTGPELARAVGVTRNTVFKWRKMDKIRAVSGPDIDGHGCYRYQRSELEKIKAADRR